jgi:hypothetical protein
MALEGLKDRFEQTDFLNPPLTILLDVITRIKPRRCTMRIASQYRCLCSTVYQDFHARMLDLIYL